MVIALELSAIKQTRWYEYVLRFVFGGALTVVTGLIAKRYGPVFGGLFLAFPAIFPASATLIAKHEAEKKRRAGIVDTERGRQAAALDARGATFGALGLVAFAIAVWRLLASWAAAPTLLAALAIWLTVAIALWFLRRISRSR